MDQCGIRKVLGGQAHLKHRLDELLLGVQHGKGREGVG
jgi:hypothetical protein